MNRRDKVQLRQLTELEVEFKATLILCLKECAGGRWGLFGAYDQFPSLSNCLPWPEANHLVELADSIRAIRAQSGEENTLVEHFLKLRAIHKQDDAGEPKLARAFLDQIGNADDKSSIEH